MSEYQSVTTLEAIDGADLTHVPGVELAGAPPSGSIQRRVFNLARRSPLRPPTAFSANRNPI